MPRGRIWTRRFSFSVTWGFVLRAYSACARKPLYLVMAAVLGGAFCEPSSKAPSSMFSGKGVSVQSCAEPIGRDSVMQMLASTTNTPQNTLRRISVARGEIFHAGNSRFRPSPNATRIASPAYVYPELGLLRFCR